MMKIYIVGSVGSGKTTLARKVAAELQVPHFETDNFVWNHQPTGPLEMKWMSEMNYLVMQFSKVNG